METVTSFDQIYEEIDDYATLVQRDEKMIQSQYEQITIQQHVSKSDTKLSVSGTEANGKKDVEPEPHYQVPRKNAEPYYEVPNSKPVPVYENVDMYFDNTASPQKFGLPANIAFPVEMGKRVMEPPKEKPPPPPPDSTDDEREVEEVVPQNPMKRMNSTKRIKKEIRNKRSSFLGLEGNADDESFLELTVAPPPDMAAFIQEERRLEKQMYINAGLCDSSDTGDSRDSGVSENHSRQSSEPVTMSSEEPEPETNNGYVDKTQPEIIGLLEKDPKKHLEDKEMINSRTEGTQQWVYNDGFSQKVDNDLLLHQLNERERMRCIEDQIQEQEEVLRVERELLQLEQEELKRQRNIMNRKMIARQEEENEHRRSLQDINGKSNIYANVPNQYEAYQVQTDYRKSMPNLNQDMSIKDLDSKKRVPPIPPAKPLRAQEYLKYSKQLMNGSATDLHNGSTPVHLNTLHHSTEEFVPLRQNGISQNGNSPNQHGNMSRHTLHALSAAPKPKFQDAWVQQQRGYAGENGWKQNSDYVNTSEAYIRPTAVNKERIGDSWLALQQKRRSDPQGFNYNKHWLIQEAEQRRIDQERGVRASTNGWNSSVIIPRKGSSDNKPLPEAVIQTLTQRVQNRLSDRKR